jgi:hypothetical protein
MSAEFLVPANVALNQTELMKARTLASVLAGVVAGTLRVEGVVIGGLFFIFAMLASSALLIFALPRVSDYFATQQEIYTLGLGSGLMGYVLTWTVVYNLCHIF